MFALNVYAFTLKRYTLPVVLLLTVTGTGYFTIIIEKVFYKYYKFINFIFIYLIL